MAGRNVVVTSGNGILSGLTLGPYESDPDDPNQEIESPWAQAVREAWESRTPDRSIGSTPYQQSPPAFGVTPLGSVERPTLGSSAGPQLGQSDWWASLPVSSIPHTAPIFGISTF